MKVILIFIFLSFYSISSYAQPDRKGWPPIPSGPSQEEVTGENFKSKYSPFEEELIQALIKNAPTCDVSLSNLVGKKIYEIYEIFALGHAEDEFKKECTSGCNKVSPLECLFSGAPQKPLNDLLGKDFISYLYYKYDIGLMQAVIIEKFFIKYKKP